MNFDALLSAWAVAIEFFLKSIPLDHADDTTHADRKRSLADFLRNDIDRDVRNKEVIADDLVNEFLSADIVVFGAALLALELCAFMFTIEFEHLKVSLFTEIELFGGLRGAEPFALALDDNGQA